jgi:FKBP-type peptidyl-prolyl cis-trans isomerase
MKTKTIIVLLLSVIALSSCKQNNWLDWKTQNELWLINNAKNPEVRTTHTGLQYKCIVPGEPNTPRVDDAKMVTINYSGKLINGYEFDANEKYSDFVNVFVPGFTEGLKLMKEFGTYEFYIPYELGYGITEKGTEGTKSHIPPYSTLIFRVELLDVY